MCQPYLINRLCQVEINFCCGSGSVFCVRFLFFDWVLILGGQIQFLIRDLIFFQKKVHIIVPSKKLYIWICGYYACMWVYLCMLIVLHKDKTDMRVVDYFSIYFKIWINFLSLQVQVVFQKIILLALGQWKIVFPGQVLGWLHMEFLGLVFIKSDLCRTLVITLCIIKNLFLPPYLLVLDGLQSFCISSICLIIGKKEKE